MPKESIPKVALSWTPPGRRKPGRPKTTWRKTVMAELQDIELSWGEAQVAARQEHAEEHCCCSLISLWGRRG